MNKKGLLIVIFGIALGIQLMASEASMISNYVPAIRFNLWETIKKNPKISAALTAGAIGGLAALYIKSQIQQQLIKQQQMPNATVVHKGNDIIITFKRGLSKEFMIKTIQNAAQPTYWLSGIKIKRGWFNIQIILTIDNKNSSKKFTDTLLGLLYKTL